MDNIVCRYLHNQQFVILVFFFFFFFSFFKKINRTEYPKAISRPREIGDFMEKMESFYPTYLGVHK